MPSGSIKVGLRLDTNKFKSGLNQATRNAQNFSNRLGGFLKGTGIVAVGGIVANALSGAVGSIKGLALGALDSSKSISNFAGKLRITAKEAQLLRRAAKISGVSLGEFEASVTSLQEKIAAANNGNAEAIEFFEKIGLKASELKFAQPIVAFTRVTDAALRFSRSFNSVNEEQTELRKILGPNGQALIQFSAAIREAAKDMDTFADEKTIENLKKISNSLDSVGGAFGSGFKKDLSNIAQFLGLLDEDLELNDSLKNISKKGFISTFASGAVDLYKSDVGLKAFGGRFSSPNPNQEALKRAIERANNLNKREPSPISTPNEKILQTIADSLKNIDKNTKDGTISK